jgi:phage antirepressor YoqD-like protein
MSVSDAHNVKEIHPITIIHTGQAGHPPKLPDLEFLEQAMDPKCKISLIKLAKSMGIHQNTLRFYLKEYGVDYR